MKWIRTNYREPLTLDQASGSLAVSREYFCRLFKKYTGQTFLEYLNDVRTMQLAKELIQSDDTITVLMEKHGLTNYKVFFARSISFMGCHRKNIARVEITLREFHMQKIGTRKPLQHRGFSIPICGNGKDLSHSLIANYFLSADKHRIPKLKNRYFSCTATSYACMIFSFPASADTSISSVDSGRWKFVIRHRYT